MAMQRSSEPTASNRPRSRRKPKCHPPPALSLDPIASTLTRTFSIAPSHPLCLPKVLVNALSPLDTIDFCLVRLNSNSTDTNDTRTASVLAASAAYEASLVTSTVNVNTSEADGWNVSNASTLDKSLLLPNYLNSNDATDLSFCVNHTIRLRSALSVRYWEGNLSLGYSDPKLLSIARQQNPLFYNPEPKM